MMLHILLLIGFLTGISMMSSENPYSQLLGLGLVALTVISYKEL